MFHSRFFWQLYTGYVVAVAVFAIIVGTTVTDWVVSESFGDIRTTLHAEAALLREISTPVLRGEEDNELQARIQRVGKATSSRLTVIRIDGVVLADSSRDPTRMNDHSKRTEILQAAKGGVGFATRYSVTLQAEMTYLALLVEIDGERLGYVRASFASRVVEERLSRVRGFVILGAAIASFVALLLGLWFSRRVTNRLESMTEVAEAMAAGDYSRRVAQGSKDEIGKLATAYNAMGEQLQSRIATITEDRNTVQAILRSMIEGVVAVDRDEVVLHMNAVAGEILDVDPAAVIGRRLWETARVNEISRSLAASLAGERIYHAHTRILKGDDECLVEISASPLTDGEGERRGAVVVFHDVTEMRRLESVRREFVVNASHELKTPITALRGFVDTMVDDPDMPRDIRMKFLERSQAQADRLAALVTDLLKLSRFESGDEVAPKERVDLRLVVGCSIDEFQGVAAEKGIELHCDVPDEPVTVLGDTATLGMVVDNLVDNAIKYSESSGKVKVVVSAQGETAVLAVVDEGLGIRKEDQPRIFERFYRVDKARSREVGGTGLGLSIVKHACGLLGGQLALESEFGSGSTFSVSLPLAPR